MNIDSHKRTLGVIHVALGGLKLVIFSFVSLFLSSFLPFIENEVVKEEGPEALVFFDLISSAVFSILILVAICSALPSIIGGIATLMNKSWGMVLLLISGCISLLSFPVGTAVGAYTIWVFVENNRQNKNEQTSE